MAGPPGTIASPRLRRMAIRRSEPSAQEPERCELCGAPIPGEHRHLLERDTRELRCVCRACSLLFDRRAAGGGHLRLVPDRRLRLDDFVLDETTWARLRIPVEMAFFFEASNAGRVMAFYPGPMGATESRLELDAWHEVRAANPVLATLEPDVEALLVNRARGARRHWLVPLDEPYRLVALIRTRWRGLTGGGEVWTEIDRFFDELDRRARPFQEPNTERS